MAADLKYDKNRPLYLPSGKRFSIRQSADALKLAYRSGNPVLIYIHGRAKKDGEPAKSVKQKVYSRLEAYGVSVIGFTWDAKGGGYDPSRPEAASRDFHKFLDHLKTYLAENEGAAKPSLLAHSMGNLLIADLADDDLLGADRGPLISNLIFSAAAVRTKHHDRWMDRIGVSERNYVLVNPGDKMLVVNGFLFRPDMLGQALKRRSVSEDNAIYVSLDELKVNHRYFARPKPKNLRVFFERAVRGEQVRFDDIAKPGRMKGVDVQVITGSGRKKEGSQDPDPSGWHGIPSTD